MTTLYREAVDCRLCGRSSEQTMIGSTNSFGSSDLDLRPPEMQRSTMSFWLQFCPHCGLVAPDISRSEVKKSVVESEAYLAVLGDKRFPELARKFLAYALLVEKSDPESMALSRLRAAWACDDAGLGDRAVECRLGAADGLTRLQPFPDDESGQTLGAILIDTLRRAGRFEWATWECESILGKPGVPTIVEQVLAYQLRLIGQADREAHTVEEALATPRG